jgi:hypothetical protein
VGVSALAGTISAPFATGYGGIGLGRWLRLILSLLTAVGILAVALPVAFGGGARGAGVDPVEVFSSGSLVAPQSTDAAQLSVVGLVPGQSRSAVVGVANHGSAAAAFSVAAQLADSTAPGRTPLSSVLHLRIARAGSGATVYSGPIGRMPRLALGQIGAGTERMYRFTVAMPSSVGNGVQGSALNASFAWSAS